MSAILKRLKGQMGRKIGYDKTIEINGKTKEMLNSTGWDKIIYHGKYFLTLANSEVTMMCNGCTKYISSGITVYRSRREWNKDYCEDCVLLKEHQYVLIDLEEATQQIVENKIW